MSFPCQSVSQTTQNRFDDDESDDQLEDSNYGMTRETSPRLL
jgi:hypothetical protein